METDPQKDIQNQIQKLIAWPPVKHNVTTKSRIGTIVDLMLSGTSRRKMIDLYEEVWNVGPDQFDEYISMARKEIQEAYPQVTVQERITQRLAEYDALLERCIGKDKESIARQILHDKSELEKLLVQQVDVRSVVHVHQSITLPNGGTIQI